jgi:hypothetical protein
MKKGKRLKLSKKDGSRQTRATIMTNNSVDRKEH